jgi:hypothetical protein
MDNAPIHQGESVQNMVLLFNTIHSTDFEILFGYQYSPDLNPIELYWKHLRDNFNINRAESNIVDRLIKSSQNISGEKIRKFILHTGKILKLCAKLNPIYEKPTIILDIPKLPNSEYINDAFFYYVKIEDLIDKTQIDKIIDSGHLKLIKVHPYGKGKRVYFLLGKTLYKSAHSLVQSFSSRILLLDEIAPDMYGQLNIPFLDESYYKELTELLHSEVKIHHIKAETRQVFFEANSQLYRCPFEKIVEVNPSLLISFRKNALNQSRIKKRFHLLQSDTRDETAKRPFEDLQSGTKQNKKQQLNIQLKQTTGITLTYPTENPSPASFSETTKTRHNRRAEAARIKNIKVTKRGNTQQLVSFELDNKQQQLAFSKFLLLYPSLKGSLKQT